MHLNLGKGGTILASFQYGLIPGGKDFALQEFGVRLASPPPFSPDYVNALSAIADGIPQTKLVIYEQGKGV